MMHYCPRRKKRRVCLNAWSATTTAAASTLLCALVICCSSALADDTAVGCWSIKDKEARLACYDKAEGHAPEPGKEDEKTANTAEVLNSTAHDPPKRVDAADLAVAPNKFVGKNIELTKAQCYYADKNEYRCLGSAGGAILMIVGNDIKPDVERLRLENDCGEIKRIATPLCRRTLRFVPKDVDHDHVGFQDRTVVSTEAFEMTPASPRKR